MRRPRRHLFFHLRETRFARRLLCFNCKYFDRRNWRSGANCRGAIREIPKSKFRFYANPCLIINTNVNTMLTQMVLCMSKRPPSVTTQNSRLAAAVKPACRWIPCFKRFPRSALPYSGIHGIPCLPDVIGNCEKNFSDVIAGFLSSRLPSRLARWRLSLFRLLSYLPPSSVITVTVEAGPWPSGLNTCRETRYCVKVSKLWILWFWKIKNVRFFPRFFPSLFFFYFLPNKRCVKMGVE